MQKQQSRHRSIISILNKIFGKHCIVSTIFPAATFIKPFLMRWTRTIHIHGSLLHSLFMLLFVCLFVCLPVCFFACFLVCLCGYQVIIASVSSIFNVFKSLYVSISWYIALQFYFNFILFWRWYGISVYNLVLSIYFVLPLIHLLFHICINMYIFLHFVLLIIFNVYFLFALFCFCLVWLHVYHDDSNASIYICFFCA